MKIKESAVSLFHNHFKLKIFENVISGKQYSWLQMYCAIQSELFPEYVKRDIKINQAQGERVVNFAKSLIKNKKFIILQKEIKLINPLK